MQKVELNIVALANSESQPNSFVVVLKEVVGNRRLPVVIGGFEAQAIALAIEKIAPNRPLTHDLFRNTLDKLEVQLREVIISDLRNGIFFATMVCEKKDGGILEIDARTSDALALAVRFGCPIFSYAFVIDEAGISFDPGEEEEAETEEAPSDQPPKKLSSYSRPALEQLLDQALSQENYERAAKIRDELKARDKDDN